MIATAIIIIDPGGHWPLPVWQIDIPNRSSFFLWEMLALSKQAIKRNCRCNCHGAPKRAGTGQMGDFS
jgi:hypothetical protein